jgi:hypothetical protein
MDSAVGKPALHVTLRATGDRACDLLRLRRVHGACTRHPGEARLLVTVVESRRTHLLSFPNQGTDLERAQADLLAFLPEGDIRVEMNSVF